MSDDPGTATFEWGDPNTQVFRAVYNVSENTDTGQEPYLTRCADCAGDICYWCKRCVECSDCTCR